MKSAILSIRKKYFLANNGLMKKYVAIFKSSDSEFFIEFSDNYIPEGLKELGLNWFHCYMRGGRHYCSNRISSQVGTGRFELEKQSLENLYKIIQPKK